MHKLTIALMALLALSCKDLGVAPADQPLGQVIFETEYVNWAWGYAYQGTVVFEDGSLYSYNPGQDSVAVLYHANDRYAASELNSKYAHRKLFIRTISSDTLLLMRQLVSGVNLSSFSDTTRVGADMGAIAYSVYRYNSDSAQYHKLVLRVDGDWTFYNRSAAAVALASLMQRL
jgi:hypothetical protein